MIKRLLFIAFICLHVNVFSTPIYVNQSALPNSVGSSRAIARSEKIVTTGMAVIIPEFTTIVTPPNDATDVAVTTNLYWNTVSKADGYALTHDTTSGGTGILNNFHFGNVSTYDLPTELLADLPENKDIFETTTPYNFAGNAVGFLEESFTEVTNKMELPFITTWGTTVINESITIPTFPTESYNYTVDWGDGVIDTAVNGNITHTYTTPGIQTISITGLFPRIFFANSATDRTKIFTIEQWGDIEWSSMEAAFYGCTNLTITNPIIDIPDLSGVSSMASMFRRTTNFNGDITAWDVGSITHMDFVFSLAFAFNQNIDGWNVSNVLTMQSMFSSAITFNKSLNNWNVGLVENMSGMFSQAISFNATIDSWQVGNVTNMTDLFFGATNFNQNLSSWQVSNVENMTRMFNSAKAFNGNISAWDVSNVTNMDAMFGTASVFNQDISNWNVQNVEIFTNMFLEAWSFNQDIGTWNITSATNITGMFGGAQTFNQDISNWDTSGITSMLAVFNNAIAFNQDISDWDVSNVTNMDVMFQNANSFDQDLSLWEVVSLTSASGMFNSVTLSTANYDALLIGWNSRNLQSNVALSAGNSKFCFATPERSNMITVDGWIIVDGGSTSDTNAIYDTVADVTSPNSYTLPAILGTGLTGNERYYTEPNGNGIEYVAGDIIQFTDFASYPIDLYIFDKTVCSSSEEQFHLVITLTTIPSCTNLITPLDMTTNVSIATDLTWLAVANADGYLLTVGTTSGATDILDSFNVGNVTTYDLTSDLTENTEIFITIVPFNSIGNATGCTEESFTTETIATIPNCTTLTSPLGDSIDVSILIDLAWTAVANANGYVLTVGTASGGTDILNNLDVGNVTIYDLAGDLAENTEIFVTIISYNALGNATGCAEESFTTETIPSVPNCTALDSPSNNETGVPVSTDLIWNAVPDADGYFLAVGTTSGGNDILGNFDVGNVLLYNLPNDFPFSTEIFVTITAYNSVGNATGCTERRFTTENVSEFLDCTTLTLPLAGASNVSVSTNFSWNPVENSNGYLISIGTASALLDAADVGNVLTYDMPFDLPENTEIIVQISPYFTPNNTFGCDSESFTTGSVPHVPECTTLTSPLDGSTAISISTNLTWTAITNADGYRLTIGISSGGNDILDNLDVGNVSTFNLPNDLPESTQIFVSIFPYNDVGDASGCNEESFTTETIQATPQCTMLVSPLNTGFNVSVATDLAWNAVTNAVGYLLTIGTTSNGNDILDEFDVGNMTTYDLPTDLPESTDIYVIIIPYNTTNDAIGCTEEQFTTETLNIIPEDDATKYGFSPDGDGVNDSWRIAKIENYPNNEVIIYNRWGDLVFRIKGYDNNARIFRGDANQKTNMGAGDLPSGTYFFDIQIDGTHNIKKTKGFLVLKR
jgi:gliding motility-associated-like protein